MKGYYVNLNDQNNQGYYFFTYKVPGENNIYYFYIMNN